MLQIKEVGGARKITTNYVDVDLLDSLEVGDVVHLVDSGINESLVSKWAKKNDKEIVILSNDRLYRRR